MTNALVRHARATAAIALLAIRAAVRSRVVLVLLLLLAAGVVGVPHLVAGDGTAASELQVRLRYTLAFSVSVLGLATLWASCAAFGAEIDNKRIALTAVKPVPPLALWLGRWLGILLLDAALLLLVVAGVRGQVGRTWAGKDDPLLSRAVARPVLPDPDVEAHQMFEALRRANRLPAGVTATAALRQITREVRNRYTVIQPGEQVSWRFPLDRPLARDGRLWLRLRFDTENETLPSVRGTCRLRRAGEDAWRAEVAVNDLIRNELELAVAAPQLAGATELEMAFVYQGKPDAPALLVQPRRALAVLTPEGSFTGNLARVTLVHFAILAALAALGLTLGACFSFPVAAFAATAILLVVCVTADTIATADMEASDVAGWRKRVDRASLAVMRQVHRATHPLLAANPLAQAVAGERVPAADLWRVVFWGGGIYPLLLALIASRVLRRREMP